MGAVSQTALAIALVILSACSQKTSAPQKASVVTKPGYSADLNELKERFNADKGKVRVLLILSPT